MRPGRFRALRSVLGRGTELLCFCPEQSLMSCRSQRGEDVPSTYFRDSCRRHAQLEKKSNDISPQTGCLGASVSAPTHNPRTEWSGASGAERAASPMPTDGLASTLADLCAIWQIVRGRRQGTSVDGPPGVSDLSCLIAGTVPEASQ